MNDLYTCPHCRKHIAYVIGTTWTYAGYYCADCNYFERDESVDNCDFIADNGPTGHGEICYSDADPGL